MNPDQLNQFVPNPSSGAILYQALTLIKDLQRITEQDYPAQACQIRDVLLALVQYIQHQVLTIHNKTPSSITQEEWSRLLSLAEMLRELYSYLRFLRASSPHQCPPALQLTLTQLTDNFFPKEKNGDPVCLVRPQWHYNFAYVPITLWIRKMISVSVLDPEGNLGVSEPGELLKAICKTHISKQPHEIEAPGSELPQQLAILSFAGLDTQDTLLYPILAHELGHFIDYSYTPPLHLSQSLKQQATIDLPLVTHILQSKSATTDPATVRNALIQRTYICLRELLADLLATRMLGFSFFVAQSEFLKTLGPWPANTVGPTGYPGIKFRLQSIYAHLVEHEYPGNLKTFLSSSANDSTTAVRVRSVLLSYLEIWKARFSQGAEPLLTPLQMELSALVYDAVKKTLPDLEQIAIREIPDSNCAQLTPSFFQRIDLLLQDLPPACAQELSYSFAEIMSAAWAYQIYQGETSELRKQGAEEQQQAYAKTCRLVIKALELSSTSKSGRTRYVPSTAEEMNAVGAESANKHVTKQGVLAGPDMIRRLSLPLDDVKRLTVIPADRNAIKGTSMDVHLGNWFTVARRTRLRSVEIGNMTDEELLRSIGREDSFVPFGKTFLIHPGDLILGATLEFFALPSDLMAFVEGRSRTGRLGLIVATASKIDPGFHGVIVLELANAGTVPLVLSPGIPIAQIVFQTMTERVPPECLYSGEYYCQIKP